jgi:4'-phosphopantetheinyl transferase
VKRASAERLLSARVDGEPDVTGYDGQEDDRRPPTAAEPVHVWYCLTEQLGEDALAQARDVLSPAERKRRERFRFARDRRDFTAAHALLRSALTFHEHAPPSTWVFQADDGGKPVLAPGQSTVAFNLAHTNGLAACVLTKAGDVGIDAESLHRALDAGEIADRYFSKPEIVALQEYSGDDRQRRFIELWTLKEAFLKAVGTGLAGALDDFGFDLTGPSGLRFDAPPGTEGNEWEFILLAPSDHHRIAVAVRRDRRVEFLVREWPSQRSAAAAVLRTSVQR